MFGLGLHCICDEAVRRFSRNWYTRTKRDGVATLALTLISVFNRNRMATLFCPSCSNLLVISAETGFNKWACNTCPYEFPITKQMTSRTRLERKQVDDVLGGEEMWKHADSIAGKNPILPSSPVMAHDPSVGSLPRS